MTQLISLIQVAVVFGTVIMFGCIGEIITEKAGNLNLGVPGIMYLGGIFGLSVRFTMKRAYRIRTALSRSSFRLSARLQRRLLPDSFTAF